VAFRRSIASGYGAPDADWFVWLVLSQGFSRTAVKLLFRLDPGRDERDDEGANAPQRDDWPWGRVVKRAIALLPYHRRFNASQPGLHERLLRLLFRVAQEFDLSVEIERIRRMDPWHKPRIRDPTWFVQLAKSEGVPDKAIRILFGLDPPTSEPVRRDWCPSPTRTRRTRTSAS